MLTRRYEACRYGFVLEICRKEGNSAQAFSGAVLKLRAALSAIDLLLPSSQSSLSVRVEGLSVLSKAVGTSSISRLGFSCSEAYRLDKGAANEQI